MLRTTLSFTLALATALSLARPAPARAWDRERATVFATLPDGATGPEGIEVDPANGDVYVATFGFNSAGSVAATENGRIYVYDREGKLLRQLTVAGSSAHLLGLAFHPKTHALLVIDFGAAKVLEVNPFTGASTTFLVPAQPDGAGLNDLTFDAAGNVYVSDSFQGIVWRTGEHGGTGTAWATSDLLKPAGVPPFGANGLRFNHAGTALFVANTSTDTVVKIPVSGGTAGTAVEFANSVNGADGLLVDRDDNLWVVANQSDEIVVIDPTGKAIAKLGDFGGVRDGAPIQMLFPASPRFAGEWLLVTNLSLDLRLFGHPTVDSQWCAQVSRYTVVRIPARIPPAAATR